MPGAAASLLHRTIVLATFLACVAVIVASEADSSIPKALDETLPIHRPIKANDLVQQIYEYQHCRDKLPKLNLQERSLHDQLLDRLDIARNAVDQLEEAKSLGLGYSHAYLKWLKLSDQYKQALQSASSLQHAAKAAAGKLRSQQNDFASHKQSIQDTIKKLRLAQFKLTAWKYSLKLVMYEHAGIKRKPSIAAASSPASSATIKMFSLRSLRKSMASTSLALSRVAKDTPGLPALISTQTDITDILDPRIPYDGDSSRRHLLSGNSEFSLAESNLRQPRSSASVSVPQLQRELDELNRRSDRRVGGSFAIKFLDSLRPDDGGMPRTRKEAKRAAMLKVRDLKLRLKFALQRLKVAGQISAFARARQLESKRAAVAVSMGRRKGASVYAMLGRHYDQDGTAAIADADTDARAVMPASRRGVASAGGSERVDPALMAEERASQLEKQSVSRREHFGERNKRRMTDVRFEQLRPSAATGASSNRFTQLSARDNIELPQFAFSSKRVYDEAQKNIKDLGDFGNYQVKLSIVKSNMHGAQNDVRSAASDYKDAVLDVQDAQKQAMRMLNTLGPRIDRWHEASVSIVKMQRALAAAHALDQKELGRFVRAAEGASVMQLAAMKDVTAAASALRQASASVKQLAQCRQDAWDRLNALHMTVQITAARDAHDGSSAISGSDAMAITNKVLTGDGGGSAIHSLPDLQDFRD